MDGHIDPLKERFALFKDLPRDRPIHMLNMIRLRERAAYPDGREASGPEAYRAYARESGPIFGQIGGKQVWLGKPELTVVADSRLIRLAPLTPGLYSARRGERRK